LKTGVLREIFHNGIHSCIYDNPHGLTERDVIQFIHEAEKQFANRFVISIASPCNCKHHISCKNNGCMSSQSIIGKAPALLYQMQIGFAGLEKHFNIPAFPVNADDFFRRESCIRADDSKLCIIL